MSTPALAPRATPLRAEAEVISNAAEGGTNRRLHLRVPGWPGFAAGQFVMLSPGARGGAERSDPLLPRPMAVFRAPAPEEVEILYKVTGRGTALLADARPRERVGLVGPLGGSFPLPASGERALLVGGGTGIASLYELAARAAPGARVAVCLGARAAPDLMGREDFEALDVELLLATEDGSVGRRGLVTELLAARLRAGDRVYACGPTAMMRSAARLARERSAGCWVSLENTMACGFGVCLGCGIPRSDHGFALVCRDGPVFEARAVDWDGLA